MFDLMQRRQLDVLERPLIVMECTVLDAKYMGISGDSAIEYMLKLKDRCAMFNGDFVFLWHNSRLTTEQDKRMYQAVLGIDSDG